MMSYGPGQCPDMQALRDQGELCEACRYLFLQGYYYRCNLHKSKQESKPMKKYRFKEHTLKCPALDVGDDQVQEDDIVNITVSINGTPKFGTGISPKTHPQYFEPIPNRWVPEENDPFYSIDLQSNKTGIDAFDKWDPQHYSFQNILLRHNNVFRTKEKAEEVLKKILQVLEENKEV